MTDLILMQTDGDAWLTTVAEFLEANEDLQIEIADWQSGGMIGALTFGGGAGPEFTVSKVQA